MPAEMIPSANHNDAICAAMTRISPFITRTPFHDFEDGNLLLKREDLQRTGSFKIRGAANKVLMADAARRGRGLVTISSGNTGMGLCHIGRTFSIPVHVFVLENCEYGRVSILRNMGATVHRAGRSFWTGSIEARQFADEHGMLFCSSGADWDFVHGAGTVGLEVIEEHPDLDMLLVPLADGGLAAGLGAFYSAVGKIKELKIIGVQPEGSRYVYDYPHNGRSVADPFDIIADCLACDSEYGQIILSIARRILSDVVLVSGAEIILATKRLASYGIAVEWGAAVTYAAYLKLANATKIGQETKAEKVGVILTGASITAKGLIRPTEDPSKIIGSSKISR